MVTETGFKRIVGAVKEGSEKGAEGVKGLQHGIRQLKEMVLAGGAVELVKRFFDLAAESAEKAKNAADSNAQAVLRFTSATKGLKEEAGDFAMKVVGTVNRVGESFGEALRYAKEFWEANLTGNRANMDAFDQAERSEKEAQRMERAFAEEKKKHGEEFKQINAEIKQTTEAIAAAQVKQLEPAQRVAELEKKRQETQAQIDSGNLDRLEFRKAELELLKIQKDLIEATAAADKAYRDQKTTANKQELDAMLKGMDTQQKIAYLTQGIKDAEKIITTEKRAGHDVTVLQAQLDDLRAQKAKAIGDQEAKTLDTKRKIAGSVQEEIELLNLQEKKTKGIATGAELDRLKQIELQRQSREKELELQGLAEEAIVRKLTPAEEKRFEELTKQKAKLDEQIKAKGDLIASAQSQKKSEEAVTDEFTKQVEEASKLNRLKEGDKIGLTRLGESYDQQSTVALTGVRDRLKRDLLDERVHAMSQPGYVGQGPNGGYDPAASFLRSEIANIEKELNLRSQVQQVAARYGETAARYQFGDTVTQRALSNLSDQQNRAAIAVEQLNQRLAAAGFGLNGLTTGSTGG